jgi:hypothetical protein
MEKITNNKIINKNKIKWFIGFSYIRYYDTNRLTNIQKNSFKITSNLHEVIIGSSLDDLNINKLNNNSRLRFK